MQLFELLNQSDSNDIMFILNNYDQLIVNIHDVLKDCRKKWIIVSS